MSTSSVINHTAAYYFGYSCKKQKQKKNISAEEESRFCVCVGRARKKTMLAASQNTPTIPFSYRLLKRTFHGTFENEKFQGNVKENFHFWTGQSTLKIDGVF